MLYIFKNHIKYIVKNMACQIMPVLCLKEKDIFSTIIVLIFISPIRENRCYIFVQFLHQSKKHYLQWWKTFLFSLKILNFFGFYILFFNCFLMPADIFLKYFLNVYCRTFIILSTILLNQKFQINKFYCLLKGNLQLNDKLCYLQVCMGKNADSYIKKKKKHKVRNVTLYSTH